MAKRMKRGMKPLIRHIIRQGVREGKTRLEITNAVEDKYGQPPTRLVLDMVRQEEKRQSLVSTLMSADKRRNINLGNLAGCTDSKSQVRAYVTLHWTNKETGQVYDKGMSVVLDKQGRLADILNKGINEVTEFFVSMNYDPPEITSADKTGSAYYRLEFVECV